MMRHCPRVCGLGVGTARARDAAKRLAVDAGRSRVGFEFAVRRRWLGAWRLMGIDVDRLSLVPGMLEGGEPLACVTPSSPSILASNGSDSQQVTRSPALPLPFLP